jgi:single-strand DNA-binding protein
MNTVTLIGTLTKDPEMRGSGETPVCQLRLADNSGPKDEPLYINVAAFGRQAESCNTYLSKGRHVAVSGRLRFREWEGKDGVKRSEHSVAADRVDFLPGGNGATAPDSEPEPQAQESEEVPVF